MFRKLQRRKSKPLPGSHTQNSKYLDLTYATKEDDSSVKAQHIFPVPGKQTTPLDSDQRFSSPIGKEFGNQISSITLSNVTPTSVAHDVQGYNPLDTLGLSLIHTCLDPLADIIFVHGLGGTSVRTWSWQRNPLNFWPAWLGKDAEICKSRVFTFGYNSNFSGQYTSLNILDFAKQLLFNINAYCNEDSAVNGQPIGTYPLIFVMHSMGGLVTKKAYIIGKSDEQYTGIISKVHAMLFLGTPHRGSSYSDTLHKVLRTVPGLSPKVYVKELNGASTSLQDINEQFRTICKDIKLVSLYETQKTPLAFGVKKMIVEKSSAILGYPHEISSGLNADHHGMCKFKDNIDPNFVQVRNVLRMFLRSFHNIVLPMPSIITSESSHRTNLKQLFGIKDDPMEDLEVLSHRIMKGSCEWILRRSTYLTWRQVGDGKSKILWLTGLPATGKSVLSAFIIDSLRKDSSSENSNFVHYFFTAGHQIKRTVDHMLHSIAFQIALFCPPFREKLSELYKSGALSVSQPKLNIIWEAIFENILFHQEFKGPIFWVIDGLDEADHPALLINLLSRIASNSCFRILIVSRPIRETNLRVKGNIEAIYDEISVIDTLEDIKAYASLVISSILPNGKVQEDLCERLLGKAHGSFLWVKLALDQLKDNWHTQRNIDEVMTDLPEGMELMYKQMMQRLSELPPDPRRIALCILTWVVCAFRPLTLEELKVALEPEFGSFIDLKDTISELCGNFVVVEQSRVILIHHTARTFLLDKTIGTSSTIDFNVGDSHIASICLKYLMDSKKRWKYILSQTQANQLFSDVPQDNEQSVLLFSEHPFLSYAVTQWSYHVSSSTTQSELSSLILEFLESSGLVWINAVALLGDLKVVTRAAQYVKSYITRRSRENIEDSMTTLKTDKNNELNQWAVDLIRIVGRFGNILQLNPKSIYRHIIPFCPTGSIIRQKHTHTSDLSVIGISSTAWDDCLARITAGKDEYPSKVLCKGPYFVTFIETGTLLVWHAESCEENIKISHGEYISAIECSKVSPWIATVGTKTIRIWDISTGEEVFNIVKSHDRRILALSFGDKDKELLIGYDDSSIRCLDLSTSTEKWKRLLEAPDDYENPCPHLISFSPDNYRVMMGYRGRQLLVWSLDSPGLYPQKCIREEDKYRIPNGDWRAATPERVVWRTELLTALVLYNDAILVEWNIEEESQREIPGINALEMAINTNGSLLVTSDHNGTLSIWTVPDFRQVYQILGTDIVRSLAFSPDGQRIYDIRGQLCNVWEPDVLLQPNNLDKENISSTYTNSFLDMTPSTSEPERPQITALVCDSKDEFYCCGKDSGAVVLFDMRTGEKIRKVYGHSTIASVIEMTWSISTKFIASADDCGRVIVKRLRRPDEQAPKWAVYPLLDFRPREAVTQLLFSSSEEFLLVSSPVCDWVWSLVDRTMVCESVRSYQRRCFWMNHPTIADHLLCIDSNEVRVFSWKTLEVVICVSDLKNGTNDTNDTRLEVTSLEGLSLNNINTVSENVPAPIARAIPVQPLQIVVQTSRTGRAREINSSSQIAYIDLESTSPSQQIRPEPIEELTTHVNCLIGSFHGHIVFLDFQYCFCTWDLQKGAVSLKRHFYLPKDWLSQGMLELCILNSHGSILCPKNGEVAIIRSGIKL